MVCIIKGVVERSVLSPGVVVEEVTGAFPSSCYRRIIGAGNVITTAPI